MKTMDKGYSTAIERIQEAVRGNKRNLNLSELGLKAIPDEVKNVKNLTTLDLRNNQISDISAVAGLTSLTMLFLSNNQIDEYDEEYRYSEEWDDQRTWGQKRRLCDAADNCYGCPYAERCF